MSSVPFSTKRILHGGDYNPDQWLDRPDILSNDLRLMDKAGVTAVSLGIFAWAALEPQEGKFEMAWMDRVFDGLEQHGIGVVLSTPSGGRPAWMARKYPEVLRVTPDRHRNLFGARHNHCPVSPVYREKTAIMNRALATRYGRRKGLLLWHISNEFGGECHCDLCQNAFREWLKARYHGDLEALNRAWWTKFWSHSYSCWEEIESPSPRGVYNLHGLNIEWRRWVTHITVDFYKHELAAVREVAPGIPSTANLMPFFMDLDNAEFAKELDVVSWDSYPFWHSPKADWETAVSTAFQHDQFRSFQDKPFLLMESTPSITNWQWVNKLKRPGVNRISSLQAVAHGSDSVMYFQWRKGRGASEKFHGAVVDHSGRDDTRVFRDVASLGTELSRMSEIAGHNSVPAEVAVVFDTNSMWAIKDHAALSHKGRNYISTGVEHYLPFWKRGIPVDVIDPSKDLSRYKIVILPMLHLLPSGFAEKLRAYTKAGGTVVATYWTGIVNETDLVFEGGWPGDGLMELFGIRDEEMDALNSGERRQVKATQMPRESYRARQYLALIHAEGAEVLATYGDDFYAGRPALTRNHYGNGTAWYIASRNERAFQDDFYAQRIAELGIKPVLAAELPEGVTAQARRSGKCDFVFVQNYNDAAKTVPLHETGLSDFSSGAQVERELTLEAYGVRILRKPLA